MIAFLRGYFRHIRKFALIHGNFGPFASFGLAYLALLAIGAVDSVAVSPLARNLTALATWSIVAILVVSADEALSITAFNLRYLQRRRPKLGARLRLLFRWSVVIAAIVLALDLFGLAPPLTPLIWQVLVFIMAANSLIYALFGGYYWGTRHLNRLRKNWQWRWLFTWVGQIGRLFRGPKTKPEERAEKQSGA